MKVYVNNREKEIENGTKLVTIVEGIRASKKDQPITKTLLKTTGKDNILFTLNGKVIRPSQYQEIEIKDGDRIKWIHPGFGG